MSRNRMKNSQSLHWMGVVKWILILGLVSILGLSYMLCKNQNLHMAEQTHRMQEQLDSIVSRNEELTGDLERMKSPNALKRQLVQMHSNLVFLVNMPQSVVTLGQNTRMKLARIGTKPWPSINMSGPMNLSTSVSMNGPTAAAETDPSTPAR